MSTQSSDTHPLAEEMLISFFRNLSVAEKISKVRSLSATVMQLSRRAIRRNHPDLDEQDLAVKCISYHYGDDLAERFRADIEGRRTSTTPIFSRIFWTRPVRLPDTRRRQARHKRF